MAVAEHGDSKDEARKPPLSSRCTRPCKKPAHLTACGLKPGQPENRPGAQNNPFDARKPPKFNLFKNKKAAAAFDRCGCHREQRRKSKLIN
jgi:hypothetical protein